MSNSQRNVPPSWPKMSNYYPAGQTCNIKHGHPARVAHVTIPENEQISHEIAQNMTYNHQQQMMTSPREDNSCNINTDYDFSNDLQPWISDRNSLLYFTLTKTKSKTICTTIQKQ